MITHETKSSMERMHNSQRGSGVGAGESCALPVVPTSGIIICFERGRLGNQLFQYPAMRMFAPTARIIAVGMDQLKQGFEGVDLSSTLFSSKNTSWLRWQQLKSHSLSWLLRAMTRLRIVTVVDERHAAYGPNFVVTSGFLRRVVFFRSGWYQFESVANSPSGLRLRLNQHFRNVAARALCDLPGRPTDRYFVHVRRGDYTTFPSSAHPAVLSLAWYREQMERIRKRNPDAVFVVTSDDKPYVEEFFAGNPGVFVIHLGALEDFAVMAGCLGGGILSASTFAWWAACLAHRESPGAYFVAPRYWVGHRMGAWIPEGLQTSWIEYVDGS